MQHMGKFIHTNKQTQEIFMRKQLAQPPFMGAIISQPTTSQIYSI